MPVSLSNKYMNLQRKEKLDKDWRSFKKTEQNALVYFKTTIFVLPCWQVGAGSILPAVFTVREKLGAPGQL